MRKRLLLPLTCLAVAFTLPARAVPPSSDVLAALLHRTFAEYRSWGRVDDELRWAPWLCRMPLASRARLSAADPGTPHAQKVFFVYASDRDGYLTATSGRGVAPRGEIVVKESFSPSTLITDLQIPGGLVGEEREFRALERDGHRIGPGEFGGLYVLAKVGREWSYGTLDATGTITAAGRIASCMGCHDDAPHDHLFGLDAQ